MTGELSAQATVLAIDGAAGREVSFEAFVAAHHARAVRMAWRLTGADEATAEEITAALRKFDPEDPVKYDFALCHLGVSRECPSRPDPIKCEQCVLQDVCGVWKQRRRKRSAKKSGELRF